MPSVSKWAPSGGFRRPVVSPGYAYRAAVASQAAPRTVTSSRPVTVTPRQQFITHYDPSRVIDLDKLKVVKDMRSQGSERGETQTGDDGELGPGSTGGAFVAPPRATATGVKTGEGAKGLTPLQLTMIAAGAFLLFGG